ncbi:hypothetical protein BPT24_032 [Tenacibaculum phage pT24]|uniref:GmrSD restriction endonucleases N-terminal domain-containing protein n=1 Tax=Tenacibaculum phage pT24 TaxID=1880590 RepID=A0A1B4XWJ3_9CAUD|nr:hypothetical protein HYP10_gp032 [Tenacibaculum phage pT24]BAV39154.1 hypothetical protein BPT24_032 [Tenacibaculum phage pT24]
MKKSLEQKIQEHLERPVQVGDTILPKGLGTKNKNAYINTAKVHSISDGGVYYKQFGYKEPVFVADGEYKIYIGNIGINPFPKFRWDSKLRNISYGLSSIFSVMGFDAMSGKFREEPEYTYDLVACNFNPFMVNKDGEIERYQRDFVWTLEQQQLLIESIFNNVDIGKIILRTRSYEWCKEMYHKQPSDASMCEVVDGKQRLTTLIRWFRNEFCTKDGIYWKDLSLVAKRMFLDYRRLSYGELGDLATDQDVKNVFLGVNFHGTPMSSEHIEYVKSINL